MLKAGEIRVKAGNEWQSFAAGPGYFKVQQDRAIALVDDAVRAEEIDIERGAPRGRGGPGRARARRCRRRRRSTAGTWSSASGTPRTRSPSRAVAEGCGVKRSPRGSTRAPRRSSRRPATSTAGAPTSEGGRRAGRARLPRARLGTAGRRPRPPRATGCSAGRTSSARSPRPPTGLDARPLTRFLDTNTFYRAVLVDGEPRLRDAAASAATCRTGEWLGTLPSPLAFARAARDEVSAETLAANVLAPTDRGLDGCRRRTHRPQRAVSRRGTEAQTSCVRALAELPESDPLALQLPFGDAGLDPARARRGSRRGDRGRLLRDAASTRSPRAFRRRSLAGVVDARSSALEEPGGDRRASPRSCGRASPRASRSRRTATSSSSRSRSRARSSPASAARRPASRRSRERRPLPHPRDRQPRASRPGS